MTLTTEDETRRYNEWVIEWFKKKLDKEWKKVEEAWKREGRKGKIDRFFVEFLTFDFRLIDFEYNFPFVFCSKCKFGEGEYLPRCTKVNYKTINGLLLQVLDEPYGVCKYYEPRDE